MKRLSECMKDCSRVTDLSPVLLMVMCDVIAWALDKQIPVKITDSITSPKEDESLNRVSSTHRECRAFDVSARGWTKDQIDECVRVFSMKYRYLAALGSDGSPRLVYVHDAGTGNHLHFQIHRRYALPVKEYLVNE